MKKHRIATTISEKHWDLLKKFAEKYETQQKALELALECLEKDEEKLPKLTLEQRLWLVSESVNNICCIQKGTLKILTETANLEQFKEYVMKNKPIECVVEFFHKKPLRKCSLKEIVDGLTINMRMSHLFYAIDYKDNRDYYLLTLNHSLGLNNSKLNLIILESLFKTCRVNIESDISENTIFLKIFKNN